MAHSSCSWSGLKKGRHSNSLYRGVQCKARLQRKLFLPGNPDDSTLGCNFLNLCPIALAVGWFKPVTMRPHPIYWLCSGVYLVRLLSIRILLLSLCSVLVSPVLAGQQVDIYRAQALVKSQAEAERNAAARATFGELMVRVSGQRNALDNPVVRAAMPKAQNYLFGFSYKSSSEKLVEGSRSFTALALQLDYEPQAIAQLLRDAQLPLWPAQRPTLLVWLVFKDQRGLHLVPEVIDLQAIHGFAAFRGLPLVFPKLDVEDSISLSADDLWALDQQKIKAASARYNADAILIGRYTPSAMGPIPAAIVVDPLAVGEFDSSDVASSAASIASAAASSVDDGSLIPVPVEPAQGPWQGDWVLLHGDVQDAFADETPEVKGLFNNAIDRVADYFANQYAIIPTNQGPQQIVLRIGNITSFAAFKQVQAYLEELALVQRMEVVTVNAEGVVVRLTTEADARLLTSTLALGRRLMPVQSAAVDSALTPSAPTQIAALPEGIDAEAMADLERAMESEQMSGTPAADDVNATTSTTAVLTHAGTLQDPLIYVWQK
ncbi:hypothetical protein B0D95_03155 [Cellvibrio sp. PSBB023]|nr:hypothetical protein B0D95_03155 [Cellvibrio sp. PSBB023]